MTGSKCRCQICTIVKESRPLPQAVLPDAAPHVHDLETIYFSGRVSRGSNLLHRLMRSFWEHPLIAHAKPQPKAVIAATPHPNPNRRTFIAQYPGKCASCGEPIIPGDECQYWRQRLYHRPCKHVAYENSFRYQDPEKESSVEDIRSSAEGTSQAEGLDAGRRGDAS